MHEIGRNDTKGSQARPSGLVAQALAAASRVDPVGHVKQVEDEGLKLCGQLHQQPLVRHSVLHFASEKTVHLEVDAADRPGQQVARS